MTKVKWKNPEELKLASKIYWRVTNFKEEARRLARENKIHPEYALCLYARFAECMHESVEVTDYFYESYNTRKHEVSS